MTWTAAEPGRARPSASAELLLPRLVPLLFLVPVVVGIVRSVGELVQLRYPAYSWTLNIDSDAQAMAFGIWPFQDPAHGYTGNAYTPLYPLLASLPNRAFHWTGWSVLITIAAGVGSAAVVARLAHREPSDGRRGRLIALLEAAGMGALAWSLVYGLQQDGLFEAKNDQLAWFFALAAILLIPSATQRLRAQVGIVLLASAAFWVKQPGVIALVAVAAGLGAAVAIGRMRLRALVAMSVAALAFNAALLALAALLTDGWMFRWNFLIDLPVTRGISFSLETLLPRVLLGVAALVVMSALAFAAVRGKRATRRLQDDGLVAVSLVVLAVLGLAEGIYLLRFAGGADNDAMPFVWALGALIGLAYRYAGAARETTLLAAVVCAAISLTASPWSRDWGLRQGDAVPMGHYEAIPDSVTTLAKRELVYHVAMPVSFLHGADGAFPTIYHVREAVSRGYTPSYLVDALVHRRFAAVFGLFWPDTTDLAPPARNPGEHNFWWKLNEVIKANYRLAPAAPAIPGDWQFVRLKPVRMRVPRHTPPALWMARCFGPFKIGTLTLKIHQGGGLWCRGPGARLSLRATPASASQLESTEPVRTLRGTLDVSTRRAPGWWSISVDGSWKLRAEMVRGSGPRLTLETPGTKRMTVATQQGESLRLMFRPSAGAPSVEARARSVLVRVPARARGTLELWSSAAPHTTFKLDGIRSD